MTRTNTPDVRDDKTGITTVSVKRLCNGCSEPLGDANQEELSAMLGERPLPDVRGECATCRADPKQPPRINPDTAAPGTCLDTRCGYYGAIVRWPHEHAYAPDRDGARIGGTEADVERTMTLHETPPINWQSIAVRMARAVNRERSYEEDLTDAECNALDAALR